MGQTTDSKSGSGRLSDPGVPAAGIPLAGDEKTVISKRPGAAAAVVLSPMKPSDVGRSLVGETLGHFRLEEFIGGGGMGAVFRATDLTLERTVAVKVVSNDETDEEMLRRFRNEAQSAARLDHPNIARVYFVGQDKRWNFIVFEYIEGENIRDLVERKGPLSIADAISFTLQIAEALQHASQRDVVHRDIKPSNILVMRDGRAKLVDMGLARLHQVDAPSQDVTATGVTLGTFDYISPEQARDPRGADVRSDLYSLGCTLYYMLTGLPPFPEGTVLQKLLSHSGDPPPDPRDSRQDIDDELFGILLKLMAKQPAQRYQRPAELIQALLLLSDRLGIRHEGNFALLPLPLEQTPSRLFVHLPWLIPLSLLFSVVYATEWLLPESGSIRREPVLPTPPAQPSVADSPLLEVSAAPLTISDPVPSRPAESIAVAPAADARPSGLNGGATTPLGTGSTSLVPDPSHVASVPPNPTLAGTDIPAGSSNAVAGNLLTGPPFAASSPGPSMSASVALSPVAASPVATSPLAASSAGTTAPQELVVSRPSLADAPRTLPDSGQPADADGSTRRMTPDASVIDASGGGVRSVSPLGAAEQPIPDNVLVVIPQAGQPGHPRVASSLAAALVAAQSQSNVDTILLRFHEHTEPPLTWTAPAERSMLTIRRRRLHSPDPVPSGLR
ncbi:MAG: protein kinase [Pirellulaceae bacterium]